jgi:CMP/dCMP kinase
MKPYKVAVDGPAGSGKSSVSKEVASRLGIKYIDSGAVYRAVTLHLLDTCDAIPDTISVTELAEEITITQEFNAGSSRTFLNGEDVSSRIRDERIVRHIGQVSDNPAIRSMVNGFLRQWAENESVIMDGRDIGTVVFPDAEVKIYLDASVDVRAERRCHEYVESGKTVDFNEIKKQISIRDDQDRKRPVGALRQAADAVYLDTSGLSKSAVLDAMNRIIEDKIRVNT